MYMACTLLQLRRAKQKRGGGRKKKSPVSRYRTHSRVGLESAQGHINSECAMIITLVIHNGIIALDLINEHKVEAKWFPG